ncbi:MAG: helix-turn-helix transcriptional regulator [Armatimonadetes bacterium]|nr:helix-turn-helix transcriptional regulator [Armatimonadota bacterium]
MDLSSRDGRRELGGRIQAAADAASMSLAELATAVGCSRALIYQYVSGQVLAQADRLQAIGRVCGRPLAWFYADEPDAEARPAPMPVKPEPAAAAERLEAMLTLAVAQSSPPDFGAARTTCQRMAELAARSEDPQLIADADFRLGHACYQLGDLEGTRAAMQRCVQAYAESGNADRERAAHQTLGAALAGLGERDRALAEFEAVIAGGRFDSEWKGRLGRADVYEALGRGEAALAELDLAEQLIAAQPEGPSRAWAEVFVAGATTNVYLLHDDFERAEASARRCAPLAEELAAVSQLIEARINLGFARRQQLLLPAALEALDDALRVARLTGERERMAVAQACRAELLAVLGRCAEARGEARAALSEAVELGSVRAELLAQLAQSEAARRAGDANEALYHAQQAVAAATAHGLAKMESTARLAVAEAQRALGQRAAAGIEVRRVAAVAERIGARAQLGWAYLAQARDAADARDAATLFEEAERLARETRANELLLSVLGARAAALGDRDAAEACLLGWVGAREALLASEVEEALLDDVERLTLVRGCLTLLSTAGCADRLTEVLTALAWPPLTAEFAALE